MDGTTLQARIYAGMARAAKHIGTPHDQYRGTPTNPLQAANKIAILNASVNINGSYIGQVKTEQLYWQIIADGAALQIGDYLVGAHTCVVVAMDALLPPLALRCPDRISITRPASQTGVGAQPYGAPLSTSAVATNLPCYINLKRETGRPETRLPGDAGLRGFFAAACWLPDGMIHDRDLLTDQNGNRYQVTAANHGLLGYELLCERLEA